MDSEQVLETLDGDGNAFAVMARVVDAMRRAKQTKQAIRDYQARAIAGTYDELLRVSAETLGALP